MTEQGPMDTCAQCGDYRHQHDERGCKVCRHGRAPWDKCSGFAEAQPTDGATPDKAKVRTP